MRGYRTPPPKYGGALKRVLSAELERRGMSQEELCKEVGVSQSMLSKTLSGSRDINVGYLVAIADALGVSCDYLLGREGSLDDGFICEADILGYISTAIEELDEMKSVRDIKYALFLLKEAMRMIDDRLQAKG